MPSVDDSIQFVKGIGPKKAKLLEKLPYARCVTRSTYPRDYEDRTHITPIAEIDMEDKYAVRAVVGTEPRVNHLPQGPDAGQVHDLRRNRHAERHLFQQSVCCGAAPRGTGVCVLRQGARIRARPHNGFTAVGEGRTNWPIRDASCRSIR